MEQVTAENLDQVLAIIQQLDHQMKNPEPLPPPEHRTYLGGTVKVIKSLLLPLGDIQPLAGCVMHNCSWEEIEWMVYGWQDTPLDTEFHP